MFEWFTEPFQMDFMRHALASVLITCVGCAALGVQIVLRRMAFMGDAMAHATLPGVVLGFIMGWNLLIGALVAALVSALGIAWTSRHSKVSEDSAIGVLYTAMFALGIVMLNRLGAFRDLAHVLLGNPMGVTTGDLWIMASVATVVCVLLIVFRRELAITLIDPEYARSVGISPYVMRALILVLCAGTVVIAMRVVGVILTAALIITPAASARLICHSLLGTTLCAIGIAMTGALIGIITSYHYDLSIGATMVLAITVIFGFLRLLSPVLRRS